MLATKTAYVVDDDPAARDSLALLLKVSGHEVRTFCTAKDFLEGLSTLPAGCVLLDIRMPGLTGMQALDLMAGCRDRFPTVIVTGHGDVPLAVEAIKAGAVNFVEKPYERDKILSCVSEALSAANESQEDEEACRAIERVRALTPRERQVLDGLLAGLQNKVMAARLGLSRRTVEIHRARMMERLGVRNLCQTLQLAALAGLKPSAALPPPPRPAVRAPSRYHS